MILNKSFLILFSNLIYLSFRFHKTKKISQDILNLRNQRKQKEEKFVLPFYILREKKNNCRTASIPIHVYYKAYRHILYQNNQFIIT